MVPVSPREVRVMVSRALFSEAGCSALIHSAPVGSVGDEKDKTWTRGAPGRGAPLGGGYSLAKYDPARRSVLLAGALKV